MELLIAGQSYSFISLPTFDDALESGGGTVSFDVRGDVPDPDDLPVVVKSGRQKIFTGIYNSLRVDCSGPRKSTLTCESNFNLTRTRILFGRFEGEATDVLQRLVLACRLEQLLGLPASPVSIRVSLALNGEFLNEALDLFKQQIGGDWRVRVADGALEVFTPESAALAPFDVGLPQNLCRPETWCQQVSYEVKPGFYSNVIVAGKNTQLFYADRKPFAVVPAKIDISEAAYPLGSTQRQFPLYKGPTRILEAKVDPLNQENFLVIVTPVRQVAAGETGTPLVFAVEVVNFNSFAETVKLFAVGPSGDTFVFDLSEIPGASGTTNLTVTPTGTWTLGDMTEVGQFTVYGTVGTARVEQLQVANNSLVGSHLTVGGVEFELVAAVTGDHQIEVGASATDTETNITDAINANSHDCMATAGIVSEAVRITARIPGIDITISSDAGDKIEFTTIQPNIGNEGGAAVKRYRILDNGGLAGTNLACGEVTYALVSGTPSGDQIQVGADDETTAANISTRFNLDALRTGVSAFALGADVTVTSVVPGTNFTFATDAGDAATISVLTPNLPGLVHADRAEIAVVNYDHPELVGPFYDNLRCEGNNQPPFFDSWPCHPVTFSYPWSVTFFDSNGYEMGETSGIVSVSYDCGNTTCNSDGLIFEGDLSYVDPLGNTQMIPTTTCGCE